MKTRYLAASAWLWAGLLAGACGQTTGGDDNDLARARKHRAEAVYLEMKGDLPGALKEYEASQQLAPDQTVQERIARLQAGTIITAEPPLVAPAPAPAVEATINQLPLEAQEELARELFDQIIELDDDETDKIGALYERVMLECPATDKAQESYWRLSNMYLYAGDEPDFTKMIPLLERYLAKYPEAEMTGEVRTRLLMAYERQAQWDQAAALYANLFADEATLPADGRIAMALSYAEILERLGRYDEARTYYEKILEDEGAAGDAVNSLFRTVARERLDVQDARNQNDWEKVAAMHSSRLEQVVVPGFEQVLDLFEYAEALEKIGRLEEAVRFYQQVLDVDQGKATRLAQAARARLESLPQAEPAP